MLLWRKICLIGREKKTYPDCLKNITVFVSFITPLLFPVFVFADYKCDSAFRVKNNSHKSRPTPKRRIKAGKKKFRPYNEAKEFAQSLGLFSESDFRKWKQLGNRPPDFPSDPADTYQKEWEGWGIFLGTGNIQSGKKKFMPYTEAKEFAQSLGLFSESDFRKWRKLGNKPPNFPTDPVKVYRKEWEGWGIFLGTGNIHPSKKKFRPYNEAKEFAQSLGLFSEPDFRKWKQLGNRPPDFPADPAKVYRKEWEGWGIFLGTGNIHPSKKKFRPYTEAKEFAQSIGIISEPDFRKWKQLGNRPPDFPSNPADTYQKEWEGWGIFLGKGNIHPRKKKFRPYTEAKIFIQKLHFKTKKEFQEWSKSGERPPDFPSDPSSTYKDKFEGWVLFLGNKKYNFMSYYQAREYMKPFGLKTYTDFMRWIKEGNRPHNIPFHPRMYYKQYWRGWAHFLGYKKWMKYTAAQNYLKKKGIRTLPELMEFLKSNERPYNFPDKPHIVYPEWEGAYAFLRIKWLSFEKALIIVRFAGLADKEEYREYIQRENLLNALPHNPEKVYGDKWQGWDYYLFGD